MYLGHGESLTNIMDVGPPVVVPPLVFLSSQPSLPPSAGLPLNPAVEAATTGVAPRPEAERNAANNFCTPRRDQLPRPRFGGG